MAKKKDEKKSNWKKLPKGAKTKDIVKAVKNEVKKSKKKAVKKTAKKVCTDKVKKSKKNKTAICALDWKGLKVEYMNSDHFIISSFLREKGIMEEGEKMKMVIAKKIKNWKQEKLKELEERADMEAEIKREINAIECKHITSTAMQKKVKILNAIENRLRDIEKRTGFGNYVVSNKDLILMLQAVKTELGEPIKIQKNQNENLDVNLLLEQVIKSDEPVDQNKLQREIYGDRDIIDVEVDGYKC